MRNIPVFLMVIVLLCIQDKLLLSQSAQKQKIIADERIVGKWIMECVYDSTSNKNDAAAVYVFYKDGSMEFTKTLKNNSSATEGGAWEVKSDSLIITYYKGFIQSKKENKEINAISMSFSESSKKIINKVLKYKYLIENNTLKMFEKENMLNYKKETD